MQLMSSVGLERRLAGEQVVENGAGAPQISALGVALAAQDLDGHEERRAAHRLGHLLAHLARKAKVGNLQHERVRRRASQRFGQQQVLRLQVAVYDASLVQERQSVSQLPKKKKTHTTFSCDQILIIIIILLLLHSPLSFNRPT